MPPENNLYKMVDRLSMRVLGGLKDLLGGIDLSRNTHPFIYGLNDPVDLLNVIGNQGRGTMRITQESYFVAIVAGITVRDNATALGNPGDKLRQWPNIAAADPTAGLLVRTQDDGNDVIWDNVGVDNAMLGTDDNAWYTLPKPYAIERNSNLTWDFTNLTADPKRVRAYLGGWKVKDLRSMDLTM